MNAEQQMTTFINIYQQLKEKLKWQIADKKISMSIASLYVMKRKEFDIDQFLHIANEIKKQSGVFSTIRSYLQYTTAAMFDVYFEKPVEQIPEFFSIYDQFVQAKFQRGNFTYISASVLLTKQPELANHQEIISKAKAIYEGMKREHLFLTSASDYPLATLLAFEDRGDIVQHIEGFYEKLHTHGFRKGNDLQFLSHILAIHKGETIEALVDRTTSVNKAFGALGIKQKAAFYPVMGMLALLPAEELQLESVSQLYQQFNSEKHFKWEKDMNFMLAACFYMSEKLDQAGLAETSIYTTMETILQAQQAVIIAAIAGATAVSASNSSN